MYFPSLHLYKMLPLSFSLDTRVTSEMMLIELQSPKSFSPELRPKTPQVVKPVKKHWVQDCRRSRKESSCKLVYLRNQEKLISCGRVQRAAVIRHC